MEASRVSVLSNAQPIVAGALGFFLLRETVTTPFIMGAIIILIGVMLTQMAGEKGKGPEAVAAGPLP